MNTSNKFTEFLIKENTVLTLIEHQTGLLSSVRDNRTYPT